MEASQTRPTPSTTHTHPLLLVAAASVSLLSLAGVATLAGWLPGPNNNIPQSVALAALPTAVASPATTQAAIVVPQKEPRPAYKPVKREAVSAQGTALETRVPATAVSPAPTLAVSTPVPRICRECGVVTAVNQVAIEPKGSGGGAVAGGIVGGLLGNQIGKGATRDIATIIGAVGGAYAGNHIEKSSKESKRYDVIVRFEDGSTQTFSSESRPIWQSGDRVRLQNGLLTNAGGSSDSNVAI